MTLSHDRPFIDPADDDPAWWPDERLATRRDELLRRQMGWLAAGSAHYQKVFASAGVEPAAVQGTDDLQRLPVTTKADLMADPAAFRLRLPDANLYDMTYATVYTTGTTSGRPTPYEYTTHDFFGVLLSGRRLYRHLGLQPGDRFFSLFPVSPLPHVAGFASAIANAAGLSFAHGMAGMPYPEFPVHRSSADLLAQLRDNRPDGVAGIGSFIRRMLVEAAADGADLSSIRLVVSSGEVLTARMRDHMRHHLAACGAKDVFIASTYAFTEGGLAWVPSTEDGPLYATAPDQIFLEILDPDTHERLPDGEAGLVAVTHLNRRGMPLVRYLLGDIAALTHEPDPHSGRRGQGLIVSSGSAHVTRTTDLLKIKGTLVNPQLIHDLVMNTPGVVEYQMVVTNAVDGDALSPDRLVLRLGLGAETAGDWLETVGERLRQAVRGAAEVTPDLELVDQSEIYDPVREFKARRLVDRRVVD
jgi:phenylacetate-coenzyme A ligase PaaK-like adenylate-forming protein